MIGVFVKQYPVSNSTEVLDLVELETGLYFIKSENGFEVQKLRVER